MKKSRAPLLAKGAEFFHHCKVCEEPRGPEDFEALTVSKLGKTLYRQMCVHCRKNAYQRRMNKARASIETYAAVLVKRARERAKKRGFDRVSLTVDWVVDQWNLQEGRCFYAGQPMEMSSGPRLVTVERMDVSRGYEPENCVLACLCVNMMRGSIPPGQFTWWCGEVAKNSPLDTEVP